MKNFLKVAVILTVTLFIAVSCKQEPQEAPKDAIVNIQVVNSGKDKTPVTGIDVYMFKGSVFDELGAAKEASEQHATVSEATGKAEFKVAAGAFASNRSQVLWFVIFDDNGNGTELVRKYFVLYEGKNESVTITLPAK